MSRMTGRHVVRGQPDRLDRDVEAVARGRGGEHDQGRIGVAAEHGLEEVGLLGLGRQAGRRAAALRVDDDERQLGRNREADGLGLERDAGAGAAGNAELAGIGGADRGADRGDLVLGLEGAHAERVEPGQRMQDAGGRGDRVGAVEELEPGEPAALDQAVGQGLGAGDGAVAAGRQGC